MKNKTLALMTAIIISSAVLILTVSLSLLNSSAVEGGFLSSMIESFGDSEADETNETQPAEPDEGPFTDEDIFVSEGEGDDTVIEDETLDQPVVNEPAIEDEPVIEDAPAIEEDNAPFVPEIGPLGNPVFPATEEWDGSELALRLLLRRADIAVARRSGEGGIYYAVYLHAIRNERIGYG